MSQPFDEDVQNNTHDGNAINPLEDYNLDDDDFGDDTFNDSDDEPNVPVDNGFSSELGDDFEDSFNDDDFDEPEVEGLQTHLADDDFEEEPPVGEPIQLTDHFTDIEANDVSGGSIPEMDYLSDDDFDTEVVSQANDDTILNMGANEYDFDDEFGDSLPEGSETDYQRVRGIINSNKVDVVDISNLLDNKEDLPEVELSQIYDFTENNSIFIEGETYLDNDIFESSILGMIDDDDFEDEEVEESKTTFTESEVRSALKALKKERKKAVAEINEVMSGVKGRIASEIPDLITQERNQPKESLLNTLSESVSTKRKLPMRMVLGNLLSATEEFLDISPTSNVERNIIDSVFMGNFRSRLRDSIPRRYSITDENKLLQHMSKVISPEVHRLSAILKNHNLSRADKCIKLLEGNIITLLSFNDLNLNTLDSLTEFKSTFNKDAVPEIYLFRRARNIYRDNDSANANSLDLLDIEEDKERVVSGFISYLNKRDAITRAVGRIQEKSNDTTNNLIRELELDDYDLRECDIDSLDIVSESGVEGIANTYHFSPMKEIAFDMNRTYWKCGSCNSINYINNIGDSLIKVINISKVGSKIISRESRKVRELKECTECKCKNYFNFNYKEVAKKIDSCADTSKLLNTAITKVDVNVSIQRISPLAYYDECRDNMLLGLTDEYLAKEEEIINNSKSEVGTEGVVQDNSTNLANAIRDSRKDYREMLVSYANKLLRYSEIEEQSPKEIVEPTSYFDKEINKLKEGENGVNMYASSRTEVTSGRAVPTDMSTVNCIDTNIDKIAMYLCDACQLDYPNMYRSALYSILDRFNKSPLSDGVLRNLSPIKEALLDSKAAIDAMDIDKIDVHGALMYATKTLNLDDIKLLKDYEKGRYRTSIKDVLNVAIDNYIDKITNEMTLTKDYNRTILSFSYLNAISRLHVDNQDVDIYPSILNNKELVKSLELSVNLSIVISLLSDYYPVWSSKLSPLGTINSHLERGYSDVTILKNSYITMLKAADVYKSVKDITESRKFDNKATQIDLVSTCFTIQHPNDIKNISRWGSVGNQVYRDSDVFHVYRSCFDIVMKLVNYHKQSIDLSMGSLVESSRTLFALELDVANPITDKGIEALFNVIDKSVGIMQGIASELKISTEELDANLSYYRVAYYLKSAIPNKDVLDLIAEEYKSYNASFDRLYKFEEEEYASRGDEYLEEYMSNYLDSPDNSKVSKVNMYSKYTDTLKKDMYMLYSVNRACSNLGLTDKSEMRFKLGLLDIFIISLTLPKLSETFSLLGIGNYDYNKFYSDKNNVPYTISRVKEIIDSERRSSGVNGRSDLLEKESLYLMYVYYNSYDAQSFVSPLADSDDDYYKSVYDMIAESDEANEILASAVKYNKTIEDKYNKFTDI